MSSRLMAFAALLAKKTGCPPEALPEALSKTMPRYPEIDLRPELS